MANYTSAKAQDVSLQLVDRLTRLLAANMPYVVTVPDTGIYHPGNPVTTFAQSAALAATAGDKIVVIRVRPLSWINSKDVFGNLANVYCPTVIQICTELNQGNAGGTNATGAQIADILSPADLLPVIAEAARTGCIVEWFQSANAQAPTSAVIDTLETLAQGGYGGVGPSATYRDLYWNIQSAT
jgi:hypothetical protein